jgi:putative endonuclease
MIVQPWYVYILSNYTRNVLYVGVTNDLYQRLKNHRIGRGSNFAPKFNVKFLVYWEKLPDKRRALARERQLKNWHRNWKIALIRRRNPSMRDLSTEVIRYPQRTDPE